MKKLIQLTVVLFLILSCTDSKQGNNSRELVPEPDKNLRLNQEKSQKLNILVDNFNNFSTSSYEAYKYYVRAYGDNPKKIKNTMYVGSTREITNSEIEKLNKLDDVTRYDGLKSINSFIKDYQSTAVNLAKINNESHTYNEMKDFQTDDFKKAKQMHKPLITAFQNFFIADNLLRHKSDSIQNIMEIAYLEKLKTDGNTLQYLIGMSLNAAKAMLTESQSVTYKTLNGVKLATATKKTRYFFDELTKFKEEKPKEFNANHMMSWYYEALKDFVKSSNELINRVKTKKPFSTGEKMNLKSSGSGWMVSGSVPELFKKYNALVDNYNRMMK